MASTARLRTIRARVTVAAALMAAVMLALVAVVMLAVMRRQLTESLDDSLRQRADALAALVASGTTALPVGEDVAVQLVAADGSTLSGHGLANLVSAADLAGASRDEALFRTVVDRSGDPRRLRVLIRLVDNGTQRATLLLGNDLGDVTEPLLILSRTLAVAVPVVVGLLTALTWWLTGRTLRPVGAIRRQLASITVTDLGRRVPEPGTGDEVDLLARTTNVTLDRLQSSVERQQRFVADASHELRGPLTRMRAALEVDLAHPSSAEPLTTHHAVLADTVALQRLVDDLLHLARSDAGAALASGGAGAGELVDLDDVVLREASALRARRVVAVDTHAVGAVCVLGRREELSRAVRNILDNAERHARSAVRISLVDVGGRARCVISDDGPGIAVADRAHVFERFARLDDARTAGAGGTGLGLAITKDIVDRHGGTIAIADVDAEVAATASGSFESGGTSVVIELPSLASTDVDEPTPTVGDQAVDDHDLSTIPDA